MHPEYLIVFLEYFLPAVTIIILLLNTNEIMEYLLIVVEGLFKSIKRLATVSRRHLHRNILELHQQKFVYFTKGDDISVLNKVMIYVQENQITKNLKIVTVLNDDAQVLDGFMSDLEVLDRAYPDIEIEYVRIKGVFGPRLIEELSAEWKIPINFMFISSPGNLFPHRVADLGGVRVII